MSAQQAELEVTGLTKYFRVARGLWDKSYVHAVNQVSFTLRAGTITALVGESGSGKSTVARLLARLYEPTAAASFFEGDDAAKIREPQGRARTTARRCR